MVDLLLALYSAKLTFLGTPCTWGALELSDGASGTSVVTSTLISVDWVGSEITSSSISLDSDTSLRLTASAAADLS